MFKNSINLLRYNNQICYVDGINTFFKRFRRPNCDTFIKHAGNFHRHVKSCKDRIQHVYPKSAYTLRVTLFELDLELDMGTIKNCSKTWLYLISIQSAFHLMN